MRTSKWFQHVQTLSNLAAQLIELQLFLLLGPEVQSISEVSRMSTDNF